MDALLGFMGAHPILTFFLALIIFDGTARIIRALRGSPECSCEQEDEKENGSD